MAEQPSAVVARRASIWEVQFDPAMTREIVQSLLKRPPFNQMDRAAFPENSTLEDILLHEASLRTIEENQVLIRQGDYGTSAFFVVTGKLAVWVNTGGTVSQGGGGGKPSWWQAIRQGLRVAQVPEVRDLSKRAQARAGKRGGAAIFLQDLPGVAQPNGKAELNAGDLFGEAAALTRTPRSANIIAATRSIVLEISWQGLRALMRYAPALKEHIDNRFRKDSLYAYLRAVPLLAPADDNVVRRLADAALFERHGRFDWQVEFNKTGPAGGLAGEPLILEEGSYPNGVYVVRSGFVRVSQKYNQGERTLAYLGKGECIGLQEAFAGWQSKQAGAVQYSLRAIGYADVILLPTAAVERLLFAGGFTPPAGHGATATAESALIAASGGCADNSLLEFMVEHRFINGTQTMLVNTDRCTGCDECVRACAGAHDGNSRFVREGPKHENVLVANACMHCHDPVCMIGCPTGAIRRDGEHGYVHIEDDVCIGCGTCANSCPYTNIRMTTIRDASGAMYLDEAQAPILKATKCDFCMNQLVSPACQNACPHDALVRIDVRDITKVQQWRR